MQAEQAEQAVQEQVEQLERLERLERLEQAEQTGFIRPTTRCPKRMVTTCSCSKATVATVTPPI